MSGTIGGPRIWRAALLLLIGAALGATLIAPVAARSSAASAPAVTTYTRSASCAGLSFHPNDSTGAASTGTLRYRSNGEGDGYFLCDPGLPNGAVVTEVQFTLLDNGGSTARDVSSCALVRSGLTRATATSAQVLAGFLATIVDGPDAQRLTDASIDFSTINNAKYGYWLQCYIGRGDERVGIYGANVFYRISAANG